MYLYTPLWKSRIDPTTGGARGDFLRIILKSPFTLLDKRSISNDWKLKNLSNRVNPPLPKGDKNTCN
jgi:hypothetical protein